MWTPRKVDQKYLETFGKGEEDQLDRSYENKEVLHRVKGHREYPTCDIELVTHCVGTALLNSLFKE